MDLLEDKDYQNLLDSIGQTLNEGRVKAITFIQNTVLQTYWTVGKHIIDFEQKGQSRAEYGSFLLDRLSRDLTTRFGKG